MAKRIQSSRDELLPDSSHSIQLLSNLSSPLWVMSYISGLGNAHALLFAEHGASVAVNDVGGGRCGDGKSTSAAHSMLDKIQCSSELSASPVCCPVLICLFSFDCCPPFSTSHCFHCVIIFSCTCTVMKSAY